MKVFNRQLGKLAEDLACLTLKQKGYQIIQRNFCTKNGEIDIIAKDKQTLVFVEVKAKTGIFFGSPEEMVNRRKLEKIKLMAQIYLEQKKIPCRIDAVTIIFTPEKKPLKIKHYQNIY